MNQYNCSYFLQNIISKDIFIVLGIVLLFVLAINVLRDFKSVLSSVGVLLLMLGGFSNLHMRAKYVCVYDALDFFGLFSFNIADILVTIGILLILKEVLYGKKSTTSRR